MRLLPLVALLLVALPACGAIVVLEDDPLDEPTIPPAARVEIEPCEGLPSFAPCADQGCEGQCFPPMLAPDGSVEHWGACQILSCP